jgi:metal-responsive CopG/Arc/MetJ family transcriptional regulator
MVAVSMPDDLFRLAEASARRLRVSRSELYAKAIAEYLERQQNIGITERLNDVHFGVSGETECRIASRPTEVSQKG